MRVVDVATDNVQSKSPSAVELLRPVTSESSRVKTLVSVNENSWSNGEKRCIQSHAREVSALLESVEAIFEKGSVSSVVTSSSRRRLVPECFEAILCRIVIRGDRSSN